MGLIKQICVSGANFYAHGILRREIVSFLLAYRFGGQITPRIDDLLVWSEALSKHPFHSFPTRKKNCWEVKSCKGYTGMGPEGISVCPVFLSGHMGGINKGFLAGRACWTIRETLCGEIRQSDLQGKRALCSSCDFYQSVKAEEGKLFIDLT